MKVVELNHPLITHKLALLRDEKTGTKLFRELISEITVLLCYEAMKDVKLYDVKVKTPLKEINTKMFNENDYVFIPILRAGMGMTDGIKMVIPNAKIGVIGMYRDEKTFKPVNYLFKMPKDIDKKHAIVIDPMLATGGSIIDAVDLLKEKGVKNIKFLSIISSPEGIDALKKAHPDVELYTACIDEFLNENKYIVPGLGDAGDRIFGTK